MFREQYTLTRPFGSWRHEWVVEGARMALSLWIHDMGEEHAKKYGDPRYSGGIEIHYRAPPDYMRDQAPRHECSMLGGLCWHDGSSLQAERDWIPFWRKFPNNHEAIFARLQEELMARDGGYKKEEES